MVNRIKVDDIVAYTGPRPGIFNSKHPLYLKVISVTFMPELNENYILAYEYDFQTENSSGLYDFWEHEVSIVDMKGAYI